MLSILDLRARIEAGTLTPSGAIDLCRAAIAAREPELRALVTLDDNPAIPDSGPLAGIAVGVKDIIDSAGLPSQMGSSLYAGWQPRGDASVVARLKRLGAVALAKTTTTAFASSDPTATVNPHDPGHTPGGSSAGSAAAVGAGMLPLALGTQTAGSVIRPASYCGCAAVKPSFRLIPTVGVKTYSWALDTVGLFAAGVADVAHALALMGVRPVWDHASTRVTGFEVLPLAMLDRPRIDVTVRVSGAFRDTFPDTLALLDRATRAVAERDEEDFENPLAAARRRGETTARVYGAAPGRYGAATAATALDGAWDVRADLGRAYLAASSHAYGDREGPDAEFGARVAAADAYLHAFDVAERDLFDGDAAVDAMGGFAAAATLQGASPTLYSLDVSVPERPKARTAREDAARLIGGRLADARWIAGQLRHGYRGAQELAQGLDAVFVLAAASDALTDAGFDRLYAAWIADPDVFDRLRAANPAATRAILERFDEARDRGLWHSRRNALPADALMPEAAE
ncbi:hypothetical protein FV228_25540 [Methylobacterium sp. WL18]|uniref:cobaltochelatase subunit CobN n=1 Tax=Methylobacterium sp. WL18 TaxID=2603897 RepID=UPI0011CA2654|nr:cobaltochelatase subunit CobN [Methylobacterium sp. WL18]TXN57623.1 hypothetical protein FV228_25540 [Methylobacterium sp. WL18]